MPVQLLSVAGSIELRATVPSKGRRIFPRDEHLAVRQQRRRVIVPRGDKAARGGPGACRRIIQLRVGESANTVEKSRRDEQFAVGQQRGRVTISRGSEAAGGSPGARRRIIQLRAGEPATIIHPPYDEHLAVGQQRGRVEIARLRGSPVQLQVIITLY